jgi:hypothetical protein
MTERKSKVEANKRISQLLKKGEDEKEDTFHTPKGKILHQAIRNNRQNQTETNLTKNQPIIDSFDNPKPEITPLVMDLLKFRKAIDNTKDFDGNRKNLRKFLANVSFIFERIPEEATENDIKVLISYVISRLCPSNIYLKLSQKDINTFDDFKKSLEEAVYGSIEIDNINTLLDDITQKRNELTSDYAIRILENEPLIENALKKNNIDNDTIKILKSKLLFNAFIKGLKQEFNRYALAKGFKSINEATEEIETIEKMFRKDDDEIKILSDILKQFSHIDLKHQMKQNDSSNNYKSTPRTFYQNNQRRNYSNQNRNSISHNSFQQYPRNYNYQNYRQRYNGHPSGYHQNQMNNPQTSNNFPVKPNENTTIQTNRPIESINKTPQTPNINSAVTKQQTYFNIPKN